jgi:HEAT repeat protein
MRRATEVTKLSEIEAIPENRPESRDRLLELSHDIDPEVRFRAIEKLGRYPSDSIPSRVREGLRDPDELVRVACIEILGGWRDSDSVSALQNCLSDPERIVRQAAAVSLGLIGDERMVPELEARIPGTADTDKTAYYFALVALGEAKYLDALLDMLSSADYRARCMVANLIPSIASQAGKDKVLARLRSALQTETTVAARSSLSNALEDISKQ